MAELLNTNETRYLALPAQEAIPTGNNQQSQKSGVDRLRPGPIGPPRPSFITRVGPLILLLPHEDDQQPAAAGPVQQRRGTPVRMSADDFHRAILDHPDDKAPRLVYADWLQERGDPRHEIVRASAEFRPSRMADEDWLTNGQVMWHRRAADGSNVAIGWPAPMPSTQLRMVWRPPLSDGSGIMHFEGNVPAWRGMDALREMFPEDEGYLRALLRGRGLLTEMPPERFAAAHAPPGSLIARGISYPRGQFTPAPMPTPPPTPVAARRRTRLREAAKRAPARLARPTIDPDLVRGLAAARPNDRAPWLVFADHLQEQGLEHLAHAVRHGEVVAHPIAWFPASESWERPDELQASGFPAWDAKGGKVYHDLRYFPAHGVAVVRLKPYTSMIGDHGNPELGIVVRGHRAVHDLAAESEAREREDSGRDWADEFAAVRDEAARRLGGAA